MATRREDDMIMSPPIIPSCTEELKSNRSGKSGKRRSFLTKVIKMNEIDHSIREREEKEAAEKEEREIEERKYATGILMAHGISQAEGRAVSRKAKWEQDRLEQTVQGVEKMIQKYEMELSEFKHRLQELEMAEVARIETEIEKKEELFNNHGHEKGYFKVPHLHTHQRKTVRKVKG